MPQFIIHSFPRNADGTVSSKSSSSLVLKSRCTLAVVDCEQIVREPIIAPESCVILESSSNSSLPDPVKNSSSDQQQMNNEILRQRKHIEISQLTGGGEGAWHSGATQHGIDSQALLLERNLIVITVTGSQESKSAVTTQTLELHFNCGIDRFFLIGLPCKLLLSGSLRVHSPTVELCFGLNLLTVSGNTMIYVNEQVVDVYGKVDAFEHTGNRRELAYEFYGHLPSGQPGEDGFGHGSGKAGDPNNVHPEYVLYFTMNGRKRPVAVFHGLLTTSPGDAYKPLGVNIYEPSVKKKKGGSPEEAHAPSTVDVSLVMNDANCKDRQKIMLHSQLSIIAASGSATVHVCSLHKACFSFSGEGNMLKVGGYLALQSGASNQLLPGGSEVVIKAGVARLYVDDNFAVLALDSEATQFEVDQWNKSKELRSISLMNTNKLRPSRSSKVLQKKNAGANPK